MLDVFSSGLISVWLQMAGADQVGLNAATLQTWETELSRLVLPTYPDSAAEQVVQQYIQRLEAKGNLADLQGVWLQSGFFPLTNHVGTTPLPAASLTKVATSIAALETWTPEHQFETLIAVTGPVQGGIVQGDLVISGGSDPFFVWEEAIALGNALNQLGIVGATGNLVITGDFSMNYESNPLVAGQFLLQALDSRVWSEEIIQQHARMAPGTPKPIFAIAGTIQPQAIAPTAYPLMRHKSLPLAEILKQMNIYSNNLMAEMLATSVGGAAVVRQKAAVAAGVPLEEIQLINGSGLGQENQISPRAVVGMFIALERYLQNTNLTVADLFPVSGRDLGTLELRKIPKAAPVKTGTLFDVSALAGAIPTRDRGLVWFAIINRGTDLDGLRDEQDRLLQQLIAQWGYPDTLPPAIEPHLNGRNPTLGDPRRLEVVATN